MSEKEVKTCGKTVFLHGFNAPVYMPCGSYLTGLDKTRKLIQCTECGGLYARAERPIDNPR